MENKGSFRRLVSWAFGVISVIALVLFEQTISAFAAKQGWDQLLVNGWSLLSELGWGDAVAFTFFALGGATLALWVENALRDRREAKAKLEERALLCMASLTFSTSSNGELGVASDDDGSENVGYWVWYLNNGGTQRNEAVLLFVEFEKPVSLPEIFVHSPLVDEQKWRLVASTDRFAFIELKGWPEGQLIVQAINSKSLGLERMSELMVWRGCGPI